MLYRGKKLNGAWTTGQLLTVHVTTGTDKTFLADKNATAYDIYNNLTAVLYEVQPDTLGKATGRTDMTGKEIFEGDILELHYHSYSEFAVVRFGEYEPENEYEPDTHIGFYVEKDGEFEDSAKVQQELPAVLEFCKVVGNIHDSVVIRDKEIVQKQGMPDGTLPF